MEQHKEVKQDTVNPTVYDVVIVGAGVAGRSSFFIQ
jgi:ribulose 1,5-bisphosphate synthetase/thiazole synthase